MPELTSSVVAAAAPGRVEGAVEAIAVASSTSGVVQEIFVNQGDRIAYSQVMARLECNDIQAEVPQRSAEQIAAESVYERLKNGSRPEDIGAAEADLQMAEARFEEAEAARKRNHALARHAISSLAQLGVAERDARIASAQMGMAKHRLALLRAGPRSEEIKEAKAKADAAKHLVAATNARLAKCEVRSPVDGIVLRKLVSPGELASIYVSKPLFVVTNLSRYRVRAEVDEKDVLRVTLGQSAVVVVNGRRVKGKVVEIGQSMGRRQILTTDPADKSDRDVLEVLIDVEPNEMALPVGMRVSVLFEQREGG